jgi:hypothetical protein
MHNSAIIYGYARVSTAARDEAGQVRQRKAAGCEKVFREKITAEAADLAAAIPGFLCSATLFASRLRLTSCPRNSGS